MVDEREGCRLRYVYNAIKVSFYYYLMLYGFWWWWRGSCCIYSALIRCFAIPRATSTRDPLHSDVGHSNVKKRQLMPVSSGSKLTSNGGREFDSRWETSSLVGELLDDAMNKNSHINCLVRNQYSPDPSFLFFFFLSPFPFPPFSSFFLPRGWISVLVRYSVSSGWRNPGGKPGIG